MCSEIRSLFFTRMNDKRLGIHKWLEQETIQLLHSQKEALWCYPYC